MNMMPPGSQLPPQMTMIQQPVPMQQQMPPVTNAAAPGMMPAQNPNYQQPQMTQMPQNPVPQPSVTQQPAPEPEKPKEVETAELISFD